MKRIVRTIVVSILCCLPVWLQAQHIQKRVVEHPGFITTNTAEIEIKKIILTDEQTQVDAVIYGKPGEIAVISPDTYLTTEKTVSAYGKLKIFPSEEPLSRNGFLKAEN